MTAPLLLLAVPSVVIGFLTIQPLLFGDFFKDSIFIDATRHPGEERIRSAVHGVPGDGRPGDLAADRHVRFEHHDPQAGPFAEHVPGGRQAGDAPADDDDIDLFRAGARTISRHDQFLCTISTTRVRMVGSV